MLYHLVFHQWSIHFLYFNNGTKQIRIQNFLPLFQLSDNERQISARRLFTTNPQTKKGKIQLPGRHPPTLGGLFIAVICLILDGHLLFSIKRKEGRNVDERGLPSYGKNLDKLRVDLTRNLSFVLGVINHIFILLRSAKKNWTLT